MMEIDLWEEEPIVVSSVAQASVDEITEVEEEAITQTSTFTPRNNTLRVQGDLIELYSQTDLHSHALLAQDLTCLYKLVKYEQQEYHVYTCPLTALNAFVLRYLLTKVRVQIDASSGAALKAYADRIPLPKAYIAPTGKHVEISLPALRIYQDLMKKVGGYPTSSGYRVPMAKVLDLEALASALDTTLPKINFAAEVLQLNRQPIPAFDGTLASLKTIPIGTLNVVATNAQSWKALKSSNKTLEEKMQEFGIRSLHDLLFTLPRRFIDKSNPQEIEGLLEGEAVTIVGKISSANELPNRMGVVFDVTNSRGRTIRCTFFRQQWLKAKFKIEDDVLLTGKIAWFNKSLQLNGSSIEHAEEAAVLPIVPIYKQSESKGVTTQLIMAANRELLARAGEIHLPPYFSEANRLNYTDALSELHFPTSLEKFQQACDDLAYYELVYMQLIMKEEKSKEIGKQGLAIQGGERKLQAKAARLLPFSLTAGQVAGVKKLNNLMATATPAQALLNADVGAGKTLVAQLGCLKAVESGYQAVLVGPTEILARQLYTTLEKVRDSLATVGEEITIAFLGAGMKVREKKPLLASLREGKIDILVGTTSTMGESVVYANLGLVCIDEQQKFGAAQRTHLLNSRSDGKSPDLLMMSATPIPRSTAQVFYGDMTMIELGEKPPGRLPIVTDWLTADPIEFSRVTSNPVWSDVRAEAAKGNQTFVITPMVQDSDKVDAASVEKTYANLAQVTLLGLNVGFVHGRMKKEEQQEVMKDFRAKKYDVLVASTVVEVGVDIPDATRVVILSADRLGASSLHQIRGRVGRNDKQSKCYLVSLGKTDNSKIRLQSLVDSEDGFSIALADLEVRGEGKMFSTEQSGSSEMIFASLAKHQEWIGVAQEEATRILSSSARDIALTDARARFASSERLF